MPMGDGVVNLTQSLTIDNKCDQLLSPWKPSEDNQSEWCHNTAVGDFLKQQWQSKELMEVFIISLCFRSKKTL